MDKPDDIYVKTEDGAVAQVYCSRCSEQIGQLEIVSQDETGEEAQVARKEFDGELSVIAEEHRVLCSNAEREDPLS